MTRPQPRELEGADEAQFLATSRKVFSERTKLVNPLARKRHCSGRLDLEHRLTISEFSFVFHVKPDYAARMTRRRFLPSP